jgi:hypothetical protein
MIKKLIALLLLSSPCFGATLSIYQNLGGNLGQVIISSGINTVVSGSSYSYIQSNSCTAYTYTDSCAFNINVTAHNTLIVGCGMGNESTNSILVSDNQSDTFSTAAVLTNGNGLGTQRAGVYYALNVTGGATTVTCKDINSASGAIQQTIHEYGNTASASFDTASSSSPASSTGGTTLTSGNLTTSVANEFVFGYCAYMNGAATGENGTLRSNYSNDFNSATEDTAVSSAGSYASTFTVSSSGSSNVCISAAFK